MRAVQVVIGVVFLFIALFGCATPLDFGDPFPKTRPADTDLPGRYLPTEETLALIKKGHYPAREMSIELHADGTFKIQNIPDWWRSSFGESAGRFDSGSGKWQVVQQSSWWGLEFEFPNTKEFAQPGEQGLVKDAFLLGQTPPYEIMLTVGDPDSGKWMKFKKVPAAQLPR